MTKFEQERFHELFKKGWTMEQIKKQIDKELEQKKKEYDDMFGDILKNGDISDLFGGLGKKKKK